MIYMELKRTLESKPRDDIQSAVRVAAANFVKVKLDMGDGTYIMCSRLDNPNILYDKWLEKKERKEWLSAVAAEWGDPVL